MLAAGLPGGDQDFVAREVRRAARAQELVVERGIRLGLGDEFVEIGLLLGLFIEGHLRVFQALSGVEVG